MAEFMRRFATGLDTYEFAEVRSDSFNEFVQAAAELADYVKGEVSGDPVQDQAIQNLANGGVRTSLPGLVKGLAGPQSSLGQAKPAAAAQQGGDDAWKGVELGKLDDGTVITVHAVGKHGPYVKAYIPADKSKVFANLPKGAAAEQIDLATAIGLIEQKMAA